MVATIEMQGGKVSGHPIDQMTFADIVRYLQGGYDLPVQRAITTHVKYCNTCAAELDRVKALRKTGHHMMLVRVADIDAALEPEATESSTHLDVALLAAYVDNELTKVEHSKVVTHMATCHSCYQQFSALIRDLSVPVPARLKAPERALSSVLRPVSISAPRISVQTRLQSLWDRLMARTDQLMNVRWQAPALAMALAVLVMVAILPSLQGPTAIPLQSLQTSQGGGDEVLSGLTPEETQMASEKAFLLIPNGAKDELVFTWPAVEGGHVNSYRVEVYNDADIQVFAKEDLAQNEWTVETSVFLVDTNYTVYVWAEYEGGGVGPVVQQHIQRAN